MNVASRKQILMPCWTKISTAWGNCGVIWEDGLVWRIILPGMGVEELRCELRREYPRLREVEGEEPEWMAELGRFLAGYYAKLAPDGTFLARKCLDWSRVSPFCRRVLEATCRIEYGQVRTYGEIAKELGNAKASRAVGAALGSNPWPLVVPCHRVVGAKGQMTGFSAHGGVKTKERMLAMEAKG